MTVTVVALVGTSCVGKTVLAQQLHVLHPTSVLVPEAARGFFTTHPHLHHERFTLPTQRQVQDHQALHEANACEHAHRTGAPLVIADRSVHDAAAYLWRFSRKDSAALHARIRCSYTHLFLLDPTGVPYRTDQVRTEPPTERQAFHHAYTEYLAHHHIPHTLVTGTEPQRLHHIHRTLAAEEA